MSEGWIIANGNGTRFRRWENGMPAWTDDREKAVRYARREDAESVHAEDDDAWLVQPYGRDYATFQGYLLSEKNKGVIDFSLRLVRGPNGEMDFYIHPADRDGGTGDFTVVGNVVLPIDDNHAAGSRPEKHA